MHLLHLWQCYETALVSISLVIQQRFLTFLPLSICTLTQNCLCCTLHAHQLQHNSRSRPAWCAQAVLAALAGLPPLEQELHERYLRQEAHRLAAAVMEAEQLA